VRVDTGVYEGGEISMFYDPMIAKLITYGTDREEARARMCTALDRFLIRGVSSNLSFLSALMQHPRFKDGNLSTNMIGGTDLIRRTCSSTTPPPSSRWRPPCFAATAIAPLKSMANLTGMSATYRKTGWR
jgi:acetyl/propionyl-CoA carboxylase alpha subunit